MLTAKHQLPRKRLPSLPTELIQLIAEHVFADNDVESLKSCSLAFSHLKVFFQRAVQAHNPLSIVCFPNPNPKYKKRVTTLLDLLDANPSFGRDCIRDIRIFAKRSPTLDDPALRLDFILSQCTELQSFTFDMSWSHRDGFRNWTSIPQRIRLAMENVLHLPSLRKVSFIAVNLPWATLFRTKKSLDCLNARYVGRIDEENGHQARYGQASVPVSEPTTIFHLHTCLPSAMALANTTLAPVVNPAGPADAGSFPFDFTNLETLELAFGYTSTSMDASWHTDVQSLLRRAHTLRKLVFHEIKCSSVNSPLLPLLNPRAQTCF